MTECNDNNNNLVQCTPSGIIAEAKSVVENLLPEQSTKIYNSDRFLSWKDSKNILAMSENVLEIYFNHPSKTMKSSTL